MLHVFWQSAVLFILYKTDYLWPNQYKKFIEKKQNKTDSGSRKEAAIYA